MGKVYVNQSSLRLELTAYEDVTDAVSTVLKYKKPSGTIDSWSATVSDATTGVMHYDFLDTELDEAGDWIVWIYVVFSDGRNAPGEPYTWRIYEEGE